MSAHQENQGAVAIFGHRRYAGNTAAIMTAGATCRRAYRNKWCDELTACERNSDLSSDGHVVPLGRY
jgi:hypothetical protein